MLFYKFLEQIQFIKVRSVIDPIWRIGIFILLLSVVSSFKENNFWLTILLLIIANVFFIFGLIFWYYFAKRDPTLLRSEELEIKSKMLDKMGDKDNNFNSKEIIKIIQNPNFNNSVIEDKIEN